MPASRRLTAGKIVYRYDFAPNPGFRGHAPDPYSSELSARIRRHNVPELRVVYFDGHQSRVDEINTDYEVRTPSIELRTAGHEAVTYCKELLNLEFCVERPVQRPVGGPPPTLRPTGETAVVAGFRCQVADYVHRAHLMIWYTDEVEVEDPTGAVLALDGVPGLVRQTEEIATSDRTDAVKRVTVTELSSDPPPPGIFSLPVGYRLFVSVDAARAEDRRLLDAKAQEEVRHRPLSGEERDMFVGRWRMATAEDEILVEIVRSGENEFIFRSVVLTAPEGAAGRVSQETASMKGRHLVVESPPNYRVYQIEEGGRKLKQVGSDLFEFTRA